MIECEEMNAIAAGRARTYALLSALYSAAPSGDLLELMRKRDSLGELSPGAAEDLAGFFWQAASMDRLEDELAAEYTRLFVLPSGVLPYESWHLDESKRLGGRISVGVRRFYEEAAAQLTQACLDLPDHIGVELEFMKFLCGIEEQLWKECNLEGLEKCLEFQQDFLADHLLRWHQPLCEKVLGEAKLGLYRALARLTLEFLEGERNLVPELSHEINAERRKPCVSEA